MKIRLTVEFEVAEENKFAAAAALETTAKTLESGLNDQVDGKIETVKVSFPTGPKAKKS